MCYVQGWFDNIQFVLSLQPQENPFINVSDVALKRTESYKKGEEKKKMGEN